MEIEELKSIWKQQEKKIERNWQLNLKLLKSVNLDKAKSKMNSLTWITLITLCFYLMMGLFFLIFAFRNWGTPHFAISGLVLTVWSVIIATGSLKQLSSIQKINFALPVPELQRKMESLKLIILRYLQLAQWIIPFYLALVIFWLKVLFDFDIVNSAGEKWLFIQLILSLTLIPLSLWFHRKLRPKNINKKWVNLLMKGAGGQISEAIDYIQRINEFENDAN